MLSQIILQTFSQIQNLNWVYYSSDSSPSQTRANGLGPTRWVLSQPSERASDVSRWIKIQPPSSTHPFAVAWFKSGDLHRSSSIVRLLTGSRCTRPGSLTGGPPSRWAVFNLQLALARVCAPLPCAVELRLEPSPCVIVHRGIFH